MNKMYKIASIIPAVFAAPAMAADEQQPQWKSSAELGYIKVSGNTSSDSLKAVFDASYEIEKWIHKAHAEALSSKSETTDESVVPAVTIEERTAARWLVSAQSDYKINKLDYVFGLISYEDDRFSGFEYQAKLGLGYGRRLIDTTEHILKAEIGPGYRTFELEPVPAAVPPVNTERQDETLVRVNVNYLWNISKTSRFSEDLTAEFGEDQDELKSVTALTANINSQLAMKLSYTIKHLDEVPVGKDKTDKETAVTLVYTF